MAGSEVPQRGAEGDADADGDRESGGAENGGYDARERSTSAAESPVGAAAAASGGPHGDAAAVQPEVEDTDVSADDPVFSDHSPVVLTGPRGCGKSTLIARLLHALPDVPGEACCSPPALHPPRAYTTQPPSFHSMLATRHLTV